MNEGELYLLQTGTFSDFKIVCQNKQFKVHRAIICSKSKYFMAMCTNDFKVSPHNLYWGSHRDSITTLSNIQSHEHAISIEKLPKTFQDAIWLTRQLDIDYLWIDALCILQDSESDKAHECARMGDYYRNSTFTISALDAADASQGFLATRPIIHQGKLFADTNSYIRPRSRTRAAIFQKAPHSRRGWTLQERLLSSRVLHYSETEMFWECLTCTGREGSFVEHLDTEEIRHTIMAETEDFKRMAFSPEIDPFDPDFGALAIWYRLITHFSRRSLTYQIDRLPAITGLAATMASKMSYQYMAGVWKEDLEGFLWRVARLEDSSHATENTLDSGGRIAGVPSWSWASLNNHPIVYLPVREQRSESAFAPYLTSVDLEIDVSNPYSRVEGGSSSLLAVCRKIACGWIQYESKPLRLLYWLDSDDEARCYLSGYCFDELSVYDRAFEGMPQSAEQSAIGSFTECSKQFMAVVIGDRTMNETTKTYFLIVAEDEVKVGHWKRVGMGWSIDENWDWDNLSRESVILV